MVRILSFLAVFLSVLGIAAVDGSAFAQGQGKDKDKDRKEQSDARGKKDGKEKDGKEKKVKQHKHQNGKDMVGEKIKKNGQHKIHENGKHSASVDVVDGKIRGVKVKHADKGEVPVKKYKTTKKMADTPVGGMQRVSLHLAQSTYLGTTYIGYAYIDDWGDEVIYWFPYEMIYDGDTGAIEYFPAY